MPILFILFILTLGSAWAQEEEEDTLGRHYVSLSTSRLDNEYLSRGLETNWGITDNLEFQFNFYTSEADSVLEQDTKVDFRDVVVGASYNFDQGIGISANVGQRDETEAIYANQGTISVTFELNRLWDSDILTMLMLEYQTNRYNQNPDFTQRTLLQEEYVQNSRTITLLQNIGYDFQFTIGHTKYRYSEDPAEIANNINPIRLRLMMAAGNMLFSFPKYNTDLGVSYLLTEWMEIGGLYSVSVTAAQESESTTKGAYVTFYPSDWFDLRLSGNKTFFESGDEEIQETSLSMGFSF
jgi:hypothetical protein